MNVLAKLVQSRYRDAGGGKDGRGECTGAGPWFSGASLCHGRIPFKERNVTLPDAGGCGSGRGG